MPSACEVFSEPVWYDPQGSPRDSTGHRFPSADFSTPIVRPNPTTGFVRVSFTLFKIRHLDARIFDIRGRQVRSLVDEIRPDAIIVCPFLRENSLVDEGYFPRGDQLYGFFLLPRQEFEGLLAQRGEKLLEFTDPWHGLLEIYAIHWE